MSDSEIIRVGKRGTVVIPAALRRTYNLKEGTILAAEMKEEGILLRSVVILPVGKYSGLREEDVESSKQTAGKWDDIDPDQLIEDIYNGRQHHSGRAEADW